MRIVRIILWRNCPHKIYPPLKAALVSLGESLICPSKNTSKWTLDALYWWHLHQKERAQLRKRIWKRKYFYKIVNFPWNPGLHGPDTLWTIITDYIRTLRKVKSNEQHMKVNQNRYCYLSVILYHTNFALMLKIIVREVKGGPWVVTDKKIFLQK